METKPVQNDVIWKNWDDAQAQISVQNNVTPPN